MGLDFDDAVTRSLHEYARAVARALGVVGDSWCVETEPRAEVYLALDVRLASFPDRDVALLWDERRGWSVAVETGSGEDLIVVETYAGGVRPPPEAVARWAERVFGAWSTGTARTPSPRRGDRADLPDRSGGRSGAHAFTGEHGRGRRTR